MITPTLVGAAMAVTLAIPCTNFNWEYSPRCTAPVAEFSQTIDGFEGSLTSGVEFKQTWYGTNVMIMEMEEVKYLVFKDHIIYLN